jgi:predicted RNA-binding protein with TRAM domain
MSPRKKSPRNAKSKRGRDNENLPVELGKEYKVDITEMSPNGEGVARVRGFLVLVSKAQLGSSVKVKIKKLDSMSAEADLVE